MTVEEALQVLQGSPTQEELFTALLVLAEQDETAYVGALPRAAEILSGLSGQEIPRDQINAVVRELQDQTPEAPEPVTISGDVQPLPEDPTGSELAGGVGPPPGLPPEGEEPQGPSFIGVPPDFRVTEDDASASDRALRRASGAPDQIEPRYKSGDQWNPSRMGPVAIRRRQKELEKAGLLEPGSYTPGFWDQATANALETAMGYANIQGREVQSILTELASLPRNMQPDEKPKFVAPPELKPDPAEITQTVKSAFRSRLGRDPTDEELADYASFLSGRYAAQHDVSVARQEAYFNEQVAGAEVTEPTGRAFQSNIGGRPINDSTTGEQSFTDVNPIQAFNDRMDRLEGAEIGFREGQAETAENMNNVFSSLRTMTGLIG